MDEDVFEDSLYYVRVHISDVDKDKLHDFYKRAYAAIIERQKRAILATDPFYDEYVRGWEDNEPYGGAIGGFFSWVVTPTSIGDAVSIRCSYADMEENVTNYDNW